VNTAPPHAYGGESEAGLRAVRDLDPDRHADFLSGVAERELNVDALVLGKRLAISW